MSEKKKSSNSKTKNQAAKTTAAKKKTSTTKSTVKNTTKSTVKSTTKKMTNANQKTKVKKDIKEQTKELTPVVKQIKKEEVKIEINKPMGNAEVVKKPRKKGSPVRNDELSKLIKIVLIVTAIMAVFYIITLLVTNKTDNTNDKKDNAQNEKAIIQYENIIIGNMLKKGGTYYVLIEADNDNRTAEYDSLVKTIKSGDDAPTIYKANLTDAFNKVYLAKEENYYVTNMAEFKVTGTTLVKVNDGKIDSVYNNYDAIKNKLNELS